MHMTSICFDVSIWELFCPLIGGNCMILLAPQVNNDLYLLEKNILCFFVSVFACVPSLLSLYIKSYETNNNLKMETLDHVLLQEKHVTKIIKRI